MTKINRSIRDSRGSVKSWEEAEAEVVCQHKELACVPAHGVAACGTIPQCGGTKVPREEAAKDPDVCFKH